MCVDRFFVLGSGRCVFLCFYVFMFFCFSVFLFFCFSVFLFFCFSVFLFLCLCVFVFFPVFECVWMDCLSMRDLSYGVAMISRLLENIGLFCTI